MSTPTPQPSTAAIAFATAILAALAGYFIGQASSLGLFSSSSSSSTSKSGKKKKATKSSWPNNYDVTLHPDSSDEELMKSLRESTSEDSEGSEGSDEDGEVQGELKNFEGNTEECKLVLVVRTDLGMGKGKKEHPDLRAEEPSFFPPPSPSHPPHTYLLPGLN